MALLAKNNQKKFIATILIVVGLFFAVNFVSPAVVKAQSPGLIDTVGTPASQGLPPPVLATENLTSPPNKDDSNEAGSVSNFVKNLIGSVAAVIVTAEGWAIWALTKVLLFVVQYNGFVTSPAVGIGWTLVRDVANLFFVVVLLAIAIATILRVESYNFKKLLPKLILMAILVNFSKTIAGLMIDFAQVVMMTFVAAFAGVAGDGNIVQALQINSIINYDFSQTHSATLGNLAGTALLMVVMLFITIIVLIVILAVLVIRVVMLWVLVVLSPLAYILAAFPQGQRYANQWWEEFTKYVIIGPVLAFFLWLTFAIASSGELAKDSFEPGHEAAFQELSVIEPGRGLVNTGTTPPAPGDITGIGNEIGRPDKLLSFVIAIAMLMGSLVITQKVGVVGGGIASSAFAGIRKAGAAPFRLGAGAALTLGRAPFQFAARKVNEGIYEGKLPRWVNPAALYRGWNERRSFLHQRAKLGATAGAEEAWEKLFTGVAQPRRLKLQIAEQSQYVSDYKFLPKERLANIAADLARQPRSPENQAKLRAVVQTAFENGYDDDLLDHEYFRQFAPKDSKGRRRHLSKEHYLKAYHHMIGDHEAGLMTLSTGDDIAHRTKHYAVAGLTDTDSKTGEVRMADYDKAAKKFNFDKAEGEAGYTAYAVEGRGLQIKEAIKEAGRARGQWHFQGEVPVIDDEELGMRVAAPFDEITRQMLGMKLKGQQERFVGEHYVTRTAMAEFGGIVGNTVADFEDDDKTMVLPGGDKYPHLLRNKSNIS